VKLFDNLARQLLVPRFGILHSSYSTVSSIVLFTGGVGAPSQGFFGRVVLPPPPVRTQVRAESINLSIC
jgi:hypothetical protein